MISFAAIGMPGVPELLILMVIVFVLFGAGKLPSVFKQFGSAVKSFRDAQKDDDDDSVDVTPRLSETAEEAREVKTKDSAKA